MLPWRPCAWAAPLCARRWPRFFDPPPPLPPPYIPGCRAPLRVALTFSELEGTMCVWVPPPPGDRLFWSFLAPPRLSLKARPQLGGRFLKYAYHASRASAWIQARMELAFQKNIVFPGGGDFPLPLLLGLDHPRAADGLPGLIMEGEGPARGGHCSAPPSRQRPGPRRAEAEAEAREEAAPARAAEEEEEGGAREGRPPASPRPAAAAQAAQAAQAPVAAGRLGGAQPLRPFVQFQLRRDAAGGARSGAS
jgi:hypothetical protein